MDWVSWFMVALSTESDLPRAVMIRTTTPQQVCRARVGICRLASAEGEEDAAHWRVEGGWRCPDGRVEAAGAKAAALALA